MAILALLAMASWFWRSRLHRYERGIVVHLHAQGQTFSGIEDILRHGKGEHGNSSVRSPGRDLQLFLERIGLGFLKRGKSVNVADGVHGGGGVIRELFALRRLNFR